jgi:hypothetical protein
MKFDEACLLQILYSEFDFHSSWSVRISASHKGKKDLFQFVKYKQNQELFQIKLIKL